MKKNKKIEEMLFAGLKGGYEALTHQENPTITVIPTMREDLISRVPNNKEVSQLLFKDSLVSKINEHKKERDLGKKISLLKEIAEIGFINKIKNSTNIIDPNLAASIYENTIYEKGCSYKIYAYLVSLNQPVDFLDDYISMALQIPNISSLSEEKNLFRAIIDDIANGLENECDESIENLEKIYMVSNYMIVEEFVDSLGSFSIDSINDSLEKYR